MTPPISPEARECAEKISALFELKPERSRYCTCLDCQNTYQTNISDWQARVEEAARLIQALLDEHEKEAVPLLNRVCRWLPVHDGPEPMLLGKEIEAFLKK